MIRTIDKTLAHLEQETPMKDSEIYQGFDPKKQAEYEEYLVDNYGDHARKNIEESKRRTKDWKKADFEKVQKDYAKIHKALKDALEKDLSENDLSVQSLIKTHYEVVNRFWTPNREAYITLGRNYCDFPDFRKHFDSVHPKLAEYIAAAMKVFAEREL